MGYSSFEASARLYQLSGWPGDVEWADWLATTAMNYPGYSAHYLLSRLEHLLVTFQLGIIFHAAHGYQVLFSDPPQTVRVQEQGDNIDDALTRLCIALWERGFF